MKLKIRNLTDFVFESEASFQAESLNSPETLFTTSKSTVEARSKMSLGHISTPAGLPTGTSTVAWIELRFKEEFSKLDLLCIEFRLLGKTLGSDFQFTMASFPYGTLKPEQEWHSGHARHTSMWATNIGSFTLTLYRDFSKINLIIQQICITSPTQSSDWNVESNAGKEEV